MRRIESAIAVLLFLPLPARSEFDADIDSAGWDAHFWLPAAMDSQRGRQEFFHRHLRGRTAAAATATRTADVAAVTDDQGATEAGGRQQDRQG